jgi:hypothetical protein
MLELNGACTIARYVPEREQAAVNAANLSPDWLRSTLRALLARPWRANGAVSEVAAFGGLVQLR